eukprot:TRINITY_DN8325_c0_g6_i1.p1 TRINITY_DN8325_c0_g6~~TRINITY_DN8325_c0_g6_i1.p1  ORF type:complete len:629 (+),score=93.44 TRINITY_DN8325_c0_g6_i1:135-2021(+)
MRLSSCQKSCADKEYDHKINFSAYLRAKQHNVELVTEESSEFIVTKDHRYTFSALVGDGGFGSVFRCFSEQEGGTKTFAIKVIDTHRISVMCGIHNFEVFVRMLRETDVIQRLQGHPNIIKVHGAYASETSLRIYIVMDLIAHKDLFSEIVRRRRPFGEREACLIIKQLLSATLHCHAMNVAHRDIKLENVLVDSIDPIVIKLADYGQARVLNTSEDTSKTLTTTPIYTPPEVVKAVKSNAFYNAFKVDSFGIGVILYGLLCSALPDAAGGADYEAHPQWKKVSAAAQDLVRQLLNPDPDQRLSVQGIKSHPWVCGDGHSPTELVQPSCAIQASPSSPAASETSVSVDRERDIKILLSMQTVLLALQNERSVSCWFFAKTEGAREHAWRCSLIDERIDESVQLLLPSERSCGADIWKDASDMMLSIQQRLGRLRETFIGGVEFHSDGEAARKVNEMLFMGYSVIADEIVQAVVGLLAHLRTSVAPPRSEVRLRLLIIVAEQLQRERAFVISIVDKPRWLQSSWARERLSRMQAARQVLIGSSDADDAYVAPGCDNVVCNTGIMSALGLMEGAPLSRSDIVELEQTESSVLTGATGAAEWYAMITRFTEKIHRIVSVGIVDLLKTQRDP